MKKFNLKRPITIKELNSLSNNFWYIERWEKDLELAKRNKDFAIERVKSLENQIKQAKKEISEVLKEDDIRSL